MKKELKNVSKKEAISEKKTEKKKEKCPRCGRMEYLWAISRRADIYVCSKCGEEEATIDFGGPVTEIEKKYLIKLGKKGRPTEKDIEQFIHQKRLERFSVMVTQKNKTEGKNVKKITGIKIKPSFTGYQMFPYLTDKDCPKVRQVLETILIFPNYKLKEIQYNSGVNEQEFMKAIYWLSQYRFIYSEQTPLVMYIDNLCSEWIPGLQMEIKN